MQKIFLKAATIVFLFGSLITFPAYLPWMTLGWVVTALIWQAKSRAMWPWLVGCVALMLVKRPGFAFSIWGFAMVALAVAAWDWWMCRKRDQQTKQEKSPVLAVLLLSAVTWLWIGRWIDANTSKRLVAYPQPRLHAR